MKAFHTPLQARNPSLFLLPFTFEMKENKDNMLFWGNGDVVGG